MRVKWDRGEERREGKRKEEKRGSSSRLKMNDGEEDEIGEKRRIAEYGGWVVVGGYNPTDWSSVALAGEGNSVSL